MPAIRMDEWIAEIQRLSARSGDQGMTAAEIMKHTRTKRYGLMEKLRELNRLGLLRHGKRPSIAINGHPCWVPVYWIEKPSSNGKPRKVRD